MCLQDIVPGEPGGDTGADDAARHHLPRPHQHLQHHPDQLPQGEKLKNGPKEEYRDGLKTKKWSPGCVNAADIARQKW